MSNPGIGVMLHMLGGYGNTADVVRASLGKTITRLSLDDDHLQFVFSDDTRMSLYDGGQSCCESRYMVTDDDLGYHIGATLEDVSLEEAPEMHDEYGETHEVQFLHVRTSKGTFTMSSHNEHNGYYGGFAIVAVQV